MKPPGAVFDKAFRSKASICPVSVADVRRFMRAHYLGKRPAVVTLALRIDVDRTPVGAVVYALPPPETSQRYGGIVVWELARLYLVDDMPTNTESWAIGQSIKYIRRHHPQVSLLVSYADPAHGHSGTIYRAANWIPDGRTDDNRKTPRFDLVQVGADLFGRTERKIGRAVRAKGIAPEHLERRHRSSKHRYIYWTAKRGAA